VSRHFPGVLSLCGTAFGRFFEPGDYDRWQRAVFDFTDRMAFQRMDDSFARYGAAINGNDKTMVLTEDSDKNWKANFTFQRVAEDQLEGIFLDPVKPATDNQELLVVHELELHVNLMAIHVAIEDRCAGMTYAKDDGYLLTSGIQRERSLDPR
jgi:hypothetical protein